MSKKMLGKLTFVLVMLALITTPVFAGSGPATRPGWNTSAPGSTGRHIPLPSESAQAPIRTQSLV
jgi:ABC-type Co2+ transport system permease subunit